MTHLSITRQRTRNTTARSDELDVATTSREGTDKLLRARHSDARQYGNESIARILATLANACVIGEPMRNRSIKYEHRKRTGHSTLHKRRDHYSNVCANDYCLEIDHPEQSVNVQFPAEIILHSYHVVVKTLLGNSTQAFHWACSPSPFCEQISCTFCALMITIQNADHGMADQEPAHENMDDEEQEEVPVEPASNEANANDDSQQHNGAPPVQDQALQVQLQHEPRVNRDAEEVSLIHRKVNRLLGRSEDIQPIRNRLGSAFKTTRASKKIKTSTTSNSKLEKNARREEELLHVVDQRTITMKTVMERTLNALEQVYNQHEQVLQELQEQKNLLRELAAAPRPPPYREHSPQPGPSSQQEGQDLRCAFCDGNHHSSDCSRFRTLTDRRRKLIDRNAASVVCLGLTIWPRPVRNQVFIIIAGHREGRNSRNHMCVRPYRFHN
ncbi:hypothetical protein OSTOST_03839, partial [Ostertagia ostertagi]